MSAFTLVYTRALPVLKSEDANIPFPAEAASGATTSSLAPFTLVDSAATFITDNIAPGDIVYCLTDSTAATVVSVQSQNVLILNANILAAVSKNYIIYQASPQTTIGNRGCYLYVGVAGNVAIDTIGGDENVYFLNVPAGTILPVQAKKLRLGTTAGYVVALW